MKAFLTFAILASLALKSIAQGPALTIYNQNFAVVRDTVPLDLKAGVNDVSFADMTATAETDSVILRDPSGKVQLQVLEQSYRNDPVSQELLLNLNEGKTIDFVIHESTKPDRVVQGKIIRAGHEGYAQAMEQIQEDGHRVIQIQQQPSSPIIEVEGKLQFSLPGEPIFPSLGDDTILNPTLAWKLNASVAGKLDAEIAYITDGLSWHADYNLVSPENSDKIDLVGWVTFDNQSGKTFCDAKIKLMAGDVNRVEEVQMMGRAQQAFAMAAAQQAQQAVTEKPFSEFHLYTISNPTTLRDQETKQVEFVRAQGVNAPRIYIYDGATMDYGGYLEEDFRGYANYGIPANKKIWVLREFKNSEDNHLGIPLPKGRLRFYQQDDDKQLEFIGENEIDHTPKDETIRVYVGNSFDLTGERRRTDYKVDAPNDCVDEAFEIKLRNHKKEPVEIRVVEHLSRYENWEIKEKSDGFTKLDSSTIEFRVTVKPDEERKVTYRVHYSWLMGG